MKDDKILDVTEDVKWIGVLDEGLVTFDVVMETKYGTSYNAYFIDAEKKTLVETAKEQFKDVYLSKVEEVVDYEDIEYIVMNHTEPDHSGSLKHLLKKAPQATVVGSRAAINFLKNMIEDDFKHMVVKDGDTLDLGDKTLKFIGAPFLHWPDSMYTYLEEDKVLFTCDSFGAHYCDENIFDDLVDEEKYDDAFKYYFDVILRPFSGYMLDAIEKIEDLEIDAIATGHGAVLRSKIDKYVNWSKEMAMETEEEHDKIKVFIPYVSAYGNTGELAENIAEGIKSVDTGNQIDINLQDIEFTELGELEKTVYNSDAFVIGSPTINQNTLLPIYELMAVMNPVRSRGKLAGAFGSYGWSGEAVKIIQDTLSNLKLKVFDDKGVKSLFVPGENDKLQAYEYGVKFGEELIK